MPDFILDSKHSPIYVRAHTKKILMETLFADSLFLADHKVMDYSLLCGIDKETNELVIGIIGMLNRSLSAQTILGRCERRQLLIPQPWRH